ncbi:hypothetical protein [Bacillus cereus]|nr:hypothetical protein [Bacillus cereus]
MYLRDLQQVFGPNATFRDGQDIAIDRVVQKKGSGAKNITLVQ